MDKIIETCPICAEIKKFEGDIDVLVQSLKQRVSTFCNPVLERNNKRWSNFAELCSKPFVGGIVQKIMVMPRGLEDKPRYYEEEWYKNAENDIEAKVVELERIKGKHLEHWGDEIVSTYDPTDPGGYYTPDKATRKKCYENNIGVYSLEKLRFSFDEEMVMCSVTKKIVKKSDCNWRNDENGTVYELVGEQSDFDPTIPGFNEFRTDSEVFEANKQKRNLEFLQLQN